MPYIIQEDRDLVDQKINELAAIIKHKIGFFEARPGILNYVISRLGVLLYDNPRYKDINEFCGVLTCVQQEHYRRVAAPYENIKAAENGDLY